MKKNPYLIVLFLLFSLWIAGCGPAGDSSGLPASGTVVALATSQASAQPQPLSTDTAAPSPTPEQGKVLLLTPPGMDVQPLQAELAALSTQAGWVLENRAELQAADLTPQVKVVVMPAPALNLNELVAAAPQTQFMTFASFDLSSAPNLTVIRQELEKQAFVAGYISTLVSPDYRSAALLPADGPLGASLTDAFRNGGSYFCGVCAPGWPLGVKYPVIAALPAASDGPTWLASAQDLFDNKKVDVYFLSPESARPEVVAYLKGKVQFERTVLIVGIQPPVDGLQDQWVASVLFDEIAGLRQAWAEVTAGRGGVVLSAPLLLENVNTDLLGEGRLRLVNEVLEGIQSGQIYPLSVAP